MEQVRRISWISDNGKYKVLVRHFQGDPSPLVGYWKVKSNGKTKPVRYSQLPSYVTDQIKIMESQVMVNRS
jgi:hypothetical protein